MTDKDERAPLPTEERRWVWETPELVVIDVNDITTKTKTAKELSVTVGPS